MNGRGVRALGAAAVMLFAGCDDRIAPAAAAGGAGATTSSYGTAEGAAAVDPAAAPYVRLSAYRARAEAASATAAADAAGGTGETGGGDTAAPGGAAADDGAKAGGTAAPDADAADGTGHADTADDGRTIGEPLDPSDAKAGWTRDMEHDRGIFNDTRAGVSLVLPSIYWDKVGTIAKADSYSVKFKRLDTNVQAGLSYRLHAATDPRDAAAAAAYSAEFAERIGEDAKAMGGELEIEATGTSTCGGLPAITHAVTIRADVAVAVRAASVFTNGRAYTLTVSGPKLLYTADIDTLVGTICKTLKISAGTAAPAAP
jgi:hypothetical protein